MVKNGDLVFAFICWEEEVKPMKERKRKISLINTAHEEEGTVVVLAALLLTVLLMFTALAVDFGMYYAQSSKLQIACDAAALGAAAYLPNDVDEAKAEAVKIMKANGFEITECDVNIYENNTKVEITKKIDVQTTFANVMNIKTMKTEKRAVAAVEDVASGTSDDYALFAGSTTVPIKIHGSLNVNGKTHTNSSMSFVGVGSSFNTTDEFTCLNTAINVSNANQYEANEQNLLVQSDADNIVSETVGMPDYDSAIFDRANIIKDAVGVTVYNDLEDYYTQTGNGTVQGIVFVKRLSSTVDSASNTSKYSGAVTIAANASLRIVGDGTNNQVEDFGGQVTIGEGGSIYAQNAGLVFSATGASNISVAGNAFIIAKYDIEIKCSPYGISRGEYNGVNGAIYSEEGDIRFYNDEYWYWGATCEFYGMIYAPKGEISVGQNFAIICCQLVGDVISVAGDYENDPTKLGGSINIQPLSQSATPYTATPSSNDNPGSGNTGRAKLVE